MDQNSERLASNHIAIPTIRCDLLIQYNDAVIPEVRTGLAFCEHWTEINPFDCVMLVNGQDAGINEAKLAKKRVHMTMYCNQSGAGVIVNFKCIDKRLRPFVCVVSGDLIRFINYWGRKTAIIPWFYLSPPETFLNCRVKAENILEGLLANFR